MKLYLLDTNHISFYFKADSPLEEKIKTAASSRIAKFGFSTSTLAELWYMVYKSQRFQQNVQLLQELLDQYTHWKFDEHAAKKFGQLKTHLRRSGRNVADVDLQIAAVAITNDLVLLTADKAFANIPDLISENWLA